MKRVLLTIPALVVLLTLTGCRGVFETDPPAVPETGGTGVVSLQFGTPAGRTLLPDFRFAAHEGAFTPVGVDAAGRDPVQIPRGPLAAEYVLGVGEWRLDISVFTSVDDANPIASGTSIFTITENVETTVTVDLVFPTMTGTGTFTWDITYNGATPDQVTVELMPWGAGQNGNFSGLYGTRDVPAGFYLLTVSLGIDRVASNAWLRTAVFSDIVHIYPGQTTHLEHTFEDEYYSHTLPAAWLFGHITGWNLQNLEGKAMTRQADGTFVWQGNLWGRYGGASYYFRFSLTDTSGWTTNRWNGAWFVPTVNTPALVGGANNEITEFMRLHHENESGVNRAWTIAPAQIIPHPGLYQITLDPVVYPRSFRVERAGPVNVSQIWLAGLQEPWALPGRPMVPGAPGTFTWEGEVGENRSFRINLDNTTEWNGNWLAPNAENVDVPATGYAMRFFPAPATGSTTNNSWRIAEAGWHVITVDFNDFRLSVERPVVIENVAVSTTAGVARPGGSVTFEVEVTGINLPAQPVTWGVVREDGYDLEYGTGICVNGILTVDVDEEEGNLRITATFTVPGLGLLEYGYYYISVTNLPSLPYAIGVALSSAGVATWDWEYYTSGQADFVYGYELRLFRDGGIAPVVTVTRSAVDGRVYDFAARMRVFGVGDYTFTVVVRSSDTDTYAHSDESAHSGVQTVTQSPQVQNQWWFEPYNRPRWVNPANHQGDYYIQVFLDGDYFGDPILVTRQTVTNPGNPAETVTTFDLADAGITAVYGDEYSFTVVARRTGPLMIDSEPTLRSSVQAVTRRSRVPNVWWYAGSGGVIQARWVNPDDVGGYQIQLLRAGEPEGDTLFASRGNVHNVGTETRTEFNVDHFALAGIPVNLLDSTYSFRVVALARPGRSLELDSEPSAMPSGRILHGGVMGNARVWTIAEYGGRFLAGADNGRIAWSLDGITWTLANQSNTPDGNFAPTAIFGNNAVRGFAYSPALGRFVAVGHGGRAAFSDDGGETWSPVTGNFGVAGTFTTSIISVTYGNINGTSVFVATGSGGLVWHSATGDNWSTVGSTPIGTTSITIMLFDGARFMAFNETPGRHAWSTNGVVWTDVSPVIAGANWRVLRGGAFGNNTFVIGVGGVSSQGTGYLPRGTFNAAGNSFTWLWSPHHIVSINDPNWSMMEGVSFGNNRFVAFGGHRRLSVSDNNGGSWSLVSLDGTGIGVYDRIDAAFPLSGGRVILYGAGRFAVTP